MKSRKKSRSHFPYHEFFKILANANPKPVTELQYRNHFELLISVMLSAQTTDKQVNRVTPALFAQAPSPQTMLDLGEEKLLPLIQTIGLYRNKGKYILKTCAQLLEKHQGQVPNDQKALEALPGVGRKTANVVRNAAFGAPCLAVDTHVARVAKRTGMSQAKTPKGIEDDLTQAIPKDYLPNAHHWLVLHGRYVCQARKPNCEHCLVKTYCRYFETQ